MTRILNVLVLCTGNSARSLIAEALFAHLGRGRVRAFSAGSKPTGQPNPLALEVLERHGIAADGLRSKSWDEFGGADAPRMDAVITVCDSAAAAPCPLWPGAPVTAHWGVPDPAAVEGERPQRLAAFEETYGWFRTAVEAVLAGPVETLSTAELSRLLRDAAPSVASAKGTST